jgi:hypothetical protein
LLQIAPLANPFGTKDNAHVYLPEQLSVVREAVRQISEMENRSQLIVFSFAPLCQQAFVLRFGESTAP